ncbi:MAG: hypothetical protein ACOC6J_09530, partial [Spirochaetota bacterium]
EQQPGDRGAGVAPAPTALWSRFWTNAIDRFSFRPGELFAAQDHGEGQLLVGTREWRDYIVRATLVPHLFERGGLVVCNRGLRRYLALELLPDGTVELVQQWDDEREVLARERCGLVWEAPMEVTLGTDGEKLRATVGPGNGRCARTRATARTAGRARRRRPFRLPPRTSLPSRSRRRRASHGYSPAGAPVSSCGRGRCRCGGSG